MENLKCQKCKNAVICKYKDNMDKVEETFPFIQSITCKFYEAPIKEPATKKEKPIKVEKTVKAEDPAEEKEEVPELAKEMNISPERPAKPKFSKDKLVENSEPKEPISKEERDEAFLSLSIKSLTNLRTATQTTLSKLGVHQIKDIYSLKKGDINKDVVNEINRQLKMFNKEPIKI